MIARMNWNSNKQFKWILLALLEYHEMCDVVQIYYPVQMQPKNSFIMLCSCPITCWRCRQRYESRHLERRHILTRAICMWVMLLLVIFEMSCSHRSTGCRSLVMRPQGFEDLLLFFLLGHYNVHLLRNPDLSIETNRASWDAATAAGAANWLSCIWANRAWPCSVYVAWKARMHKMLTFFAFIYEMSAILKNCQL